MQKRIYGFAGTAHKYMALDKLVKQLRQERDTTRAYAQEKEGKVAQLMKDTMNEIEKWDSDTAELRGQLHNVRDKHVSQNIDHSKEQQTPLESSDSYNVLCTIQ